MNSSTVIPLSGFSNREYTGSRVPVQSQSLLCFPGMLSTPGQVLQFRMGERILLRPGLCQQDRDHLGPLHVGSPQVRSLQPGPPDVGVPEIGSPQVRIPEVRS